MTGIQSRSGHGVRTRARIGAASVAALLAIALAACGGGGGDSTPTSASTPKTTADVPQTTPSGATAITPAPAFTAEQLAATPNDDWITNGGSLSNDRYSPLTQINDGNVAGLKGVWMTHLKSGLANKFSGEGQALEYKGILYESTGADDIFALDVKTGKILWTYKPHLPADPLGDVICCGWDNRGVALGDGKVYVGQLNGDLVALDQMTGKVQWSVPVVNAKSGYSITSAPLYYNGLVYIGGSGGEYGVRGRLTAFDAKTGKQAWKFYTVPSPGEVGGDTWPKGTNAYKHGGAAIWNTPTVDPELNMLYFSTSNASPGYYGAIRKGDNLFTSSMVALDAKTGEYKWHYQQVHHDLWDFDAPSPTVLVDAPMMGKMQKAVAEPSKTGWLYVLDRATGKPIFPIKEKPVAQDPKQDTAKTQPYPTLPAFAPHRPTKQAMQVLRAAQKSSPHPPKLVASQLFEPPSRNPKVLTITALDNIGGDNWPPSSFDQQNKMYYVCAQTGATGFLVDTKPPKYKAGGQYGGNVDGVAAFNGFNSPGILTAYDLSTGTIKWQKHFPDSCYSGAVTTAGNLVFVGRNKGQLQAFNAMTGELLWSFQTGAGANTTATVFEHEGQEYVAILAGGNSLAASPHGDNMWLFSLKGTMGQLAGTGAAGGTEHKGTGESAKEQGKSSKPTAKTKTDAGGSDNGGKAATTAGDAGAGKSVFADNCATCHGAKGTGGNGGPDLTSIPSAKDLAAVSTQVTNGGGGMPAFKGQLSAKQIADVSAYVVKVINGG
jgi:alcohol dehydrogenase (cytochrome c)